MQTVEYLVTKVPIQGYSLAVLYPITPFWWRKGAWKKDPWLIITWEVMRKCLIGRLGAGEDDLAEVSYDAPMLSCSGKITGTLPRLRRAELRAFICLVYAETCRISRVQGRAIPVHGFCLQIRAQAGHHLDCFFLMRPRQEKSVMSSQTSDLQNWKRIHFHCFKVLSVTLSGTSDSANPWTVACQAPLSMEFSRQEY